MDLFASHIDIEWTVIETKKKQKTPEEFNMCCLFVFFFAVQGCRLQLNKNTLLHCMSKISLGFMAKYGAHVP